MNWQNVTPVIISIFVIILVAILEKYSRLVAAITATMPLGITLGLWIVYASAEGEREAVQMFTDGLVVGIIPSLVFLAAVWFGAREGYRLGQLLGIGYLGWGIALGVTLGVRKMMGL